jgi:hypothetical protein
MAVEYPEEQIALEPNAHEFLKKEDFNALMKKYEHPLATQMGEKAKKNRWAWRHGLYYGLSPDLLFAKRLTP